MAPEDNNNERPVVSFVIQLVDGRVIRHPRIDWTQGQAAEYLTALLEQAASDDGMGDDLEEIFGPVLDDYEAILAGAEVIPLAIEPDPMVNERERKEFDVQFLGRSKRVVAGRVNVAQDSLIGETDDVTDTAVRAVAEYVIHAFDGALETEYEDGVTYQIQVVKIGQRRRDGGRYGLHPGGMIVGYGDGRQDDWRQ